MSKQTGLSVSDIGQWIDNDEGLYLWWKRSRQRKKEFIKENMKELKGYINLRLNRN